jgi:hypothetical protein
MALNVGSLRCRSLPESEVDRTLGRHRENGAHDPIRTFALMSSCMRQSHNSLAGIEDLLVNPAILPNRMASLETRQRTPPSWRTLQVP